MRADRLISLVLTLQDGGRTTAARLAAQLGASRRTILRDLDALSLSGVPVLAEGGPGGGVWLDEGYRTSLTGLKEDELRALLAAGDGRLLEDLGWGDAVTSGQRKLRASVPRRFESSVEFVRRRLVLDPHWWWHERDTSPLSVLQDAVWKSRTVVGAYESWDGHERPVALEAYGLAAKAGLWYFVARRDGEWRTYRVSRFRDLRLGPPFVRDPGFDLSQWWPEHSREFAAEFSAYRFTVALPRERERYLRAIAPGRVDVVGVYGELPDWIVAEVGLDSALYAELVVLGLGRDGVVLNNPELQAAVVKRAKEALEAQSAPTAGPPPPH